MGLCLVAVLGGVRSLAQIARFAADAAPEVHDLAVTSLFPEQAGPARLAELGLAHWSVEALHHVRDVTYGEHGMTPMTGPHMKCAFPGCTEVCRNVTSFTARTGGSSRTGRRRSIR
ncbi:hypothetical protein [Streptomyces fungicidicus]|uniref:hypothetical protein n=1 Tax=Streptomyces fungicidicus TaxID=68203 RepID=UPI0036C359E3